MTLHDLNIKFQVKVKNEHLEMNTTQKTNSLSQRYFKKLTSNAISLVSGFVITSIVPKALGPLAYGQYSYIVDLFNQFFVFLESGSSNALYNKVSQKTENIKLIKKYLLFILLINLIILGSYLIASISGLSHYIFSDLTFNLIFLGFLMGSFSWLQTILVKILDGLGLTTEMEQLRIFTAFIKVVAIIGLFTLSLLDIYSFFVFQILSTLILNILFIYIIYKVYKNITNKEFTEEETKENFKYFWSYSHPLFLYTLIATLSLVADRWLIKTYSGLTEQGYFALASQIATVCFIFSSSMTPLFHREIAINWSEKNKERSILIIETAFSILYLIASYLGVFCAVNADSIVHLLAGPQFQGQTLAYALMFLFPIHQTYGQLVGGIYYATDNTKSYRNLGSIVIIIGIILSFIVLNPNIGPSLGFNGGFESLAIKTVFIQFLSVNLMLFYALKSFELKIWRFLRSQFFIVVLAAMAAFAGQKIAYLIFPDQHSFYFFIASGFNYTIACVLLFFVSIKLKIPLFITNNNAEVNYINAKIKELLVKFKK